MSDSDQVAKVGVAVALVAIVVGVLTPEVRARFGLEPQVRPHAGPIDDTQATAPSPEALQKVVTSNPSSSESDYAVTKPRAEVSEKTNATAAFDRDEKSVFESLARNAYPDDQENIGRYREKIERSLLKHMAKDKTMSELWRFLEAKNCATLEIVNGILRFYDGTHQLIDITPFLAS